MPEVTDPTEPEEPTQDSPAPVEETTASLAPRRPGRRLPKEPSQEELDALPVEKRLELINQQRQGRHQTFNSIGILFGVLFTAASLVATAVTVRTTQRELQNNQNELRNSREGQITDRYTRAVDQLGSAKLDIRLGGIYALERLATDSPRDDRTVYDVLCAFVREHDPKPGAKVPDQPATDIHAALTVIGRRKLLDDGFTADLDGIRVHRASLSGTDLSGTDLSDADLSRADLSRAKLSGAQLIRTDLPDADLSDADLSRADLSGAKLPFARLIRAGLSGASLSGAHLNGANLTGAHLTRAALISTDLSYARLIRADLSGTKLFSARLSHANLSGTDLSFADLSFADLSDADLSGANLRGMQGMTPDQIRKQAHTDSKTRF